jgi:hypothetical protein
MLWKQAADKVIEVAEEMSELGSTKQIINRLLEPFMWHTVIVTATEWENFFALRCPQYNVNGDIFRSKKDTCRMYDLNYHADSMEWFRMNKGQAEIHMMALAEAMWDAYNESKPNELLPGQWHIPFGDKLSDEVKGTAYGPLFGVKVATAMCARVSYTTVGDEKELPSWEKLMELHDRLAASGHWSPFEHCAKAMDSKEYAYSLNGPFKLDSRYEEFSGQPGGQTRTIITGSKGWSGNFQGFIQYRKTFTNENITAK